MNIFHYVCFIVNYIDTVAILAQVFVTYPSLGRMNDREPKSEPESEPDPRFNSEMIVSPISMNEREKSQTNALRRFLRSFHEFLKREYPNILKERRMIFPDTGGINHFTSKVKITPLKGSFLAQQKVRYINFVVSSMADMSRVLYLGFFSQDTCLCLPEPEPCFDLRDMHKICAYLHEAFGWRSDSFECIEVIEWDGLNYANFKSVH